MQRANYCTVMLSASMLLRLCVFVKLGTYLCVFIVSSHSLSILAAIFAVEPGLAGFIEAEDD